MLRREGVSAGKGEHECQGRGEGEGTEREGREWRPVCEIEGSRGHASGWPTGRETAISIYTGDMNKLSTSSSWQSIKAAIECSLSSQVNQEVKVHKNCICICYSRNVAYAGERELPFVLLNGVRTKLPNFKTRLCFIITLATV